MLKDFSSFSNESTFVLFYNNYYLVEVFLYFVFCDGFKLILSMRRSGVMELIVRRNKKRLSLFVLSLLTLVVALLPTTEAHAAYRYVLNKQYKTYTTSSAFKYIRGGLGIKVHCSNSKAADQKMYLQRYMNGKWVNRGERIIKCSRGAKKYNYFYIPNTVSGQTYRLHFVNLKAYTTTTSLLAEVNPN
jgi:hypothetical protein